MDPPDAIEARYRRLQAASDANRPALTVARARRFLVDYPDFTVAWVLLGHALTEMANYDEAKAALETALRLSPPEQTRRPLVTMGDYYKARGDYPSAAEWYQRSIGVAPEHAAAYIYLGGVLARQGRLDEAEAAYRAATSCRDGRIEEAYLNLGLILRAQERLVESAEALIHAIELDPDYPEARWALRDVQKAIRYLRRIKA